MVVLYHLGGTIASDSNFGIAAFSVPFAFGYAGVPFFFVLSGFIIFFAHRNDIFKSQMLTAYLRKRFARIYPTYWIVFLTIFIMAITSGLLKNTIPQVPLDPIVIGKALLLIPQDPRVIGGTGAPVIAAAWTLQYEMVFYLFFACLILSRWLSLAAVGALIYCFIARYSADESPSFFISFVTSDYIFLFMMGMAASFAHTSNKLVVSRPRWVVCSGSLMFLLIASTDLFGVGIAHKTLFYGVACSLIIFGLVKCEDMGSGFLEGKWFQKLGNASYVLYLIHYQIIGMFTKLAITLHLNKLGLPAAIVTYLTIFLICLISAVIFNEQIEKRIAAFFRRRRIQSTT